MKTISTKVELIEWLKSEALYSDIWSEDDIPDVKPVRKSKWKEAEFEPDWIFDEVFVEVPRGEIREEIGGRVRVILDLTEHNSTVRVKFMRTSRRNYCTAISKLGYVDLLKDKVQACKTQQRLLELINAHFKYKISLERE